MDVREVNLFFIEISPDHFVRETGTFIYHLFIEQYLFAFDCANYKRWLPLYYENYLALEQKKSKIHASFLKGDFVVQHFCRKRKHCAYRYSP